MNRGNTMPIPKKLTLSDKPTTRIRPLPDDAVHYAVGTLYIQS